MAKKSRERKSGDRRGQQGPMLDPRVKNDLIALALLIAAILSALSFFHLAGPFGEAVHVQLSAVFGYLKFLFPLVLLSAAGRIVYPKKFAGRGLAAFGFFLFFASFGALLNLLRYPNKEAMLVVENISGAGGYVGLLVGYPLLAAMGYWASLVLLLGLLATSIVLTFNISLIDLIGMFKRPRSMSETNNEQGAPIPPDGAQENELAAAQPNFAQRLLGRKTMENEVEEPVMANHGDGLSSGIMKKRHKSISIPVALLENKLMKPTSGDIQGRMMAIRKTLENFDIDVEMGEVSVGPTVTQFTLKPADGVRLNRITALSNDLALALAAHPIRIEAPIPGKALVGIEVPNQTVASVGLREILESKEFAARKSNLTICLGKDVAGRPWTADLGRMPHLLVAGATGSGKTVCLNAIILSLLYQNNPDDLKLILIDPKRVELPTYNGIPHLLAKAITEVPKIINSLKWAIEEMDHRFDVLSKAGKRDIASYNESVGANDKMPYLVIIIDELADLMVASASEVETSIIRLAQLARAVGIHLIVATQRPSVDVITGLIKANITTRIAFSVASSMDSRTILDTPGAEKLVGRGDMLFMTAELSKPKRIQCVYVGDNDIRNVVDHLTAQLEEAMIYDESITEKKSAGGFDFSGGNGNDDGEDALFEEAKDTVVRAGKASASYLQRRLKVGYARAARLLDLLEERGIIGPGDGAKPRDILVPHGSEDVAGSEEGF